MFFATAPVYLCTIYLYKQTRTSWVQMSLCSGRHLVMKVFFHYLGRGKDLGLFGVIGSLMRVGKTGGPVE